MTTLTPISFGALPTAATPLQGTDIGVISRGGTIVGQYQLSALSAYIQSVIGGSGTVTSISGSGGTTGLTLTGGPITASGTLTLGGTLAIANGGTNLTTAPTNGQLLIGNGAGYTLGTLTAGSNVTITNSAGVITISASGGGGGGGTVTSVAVSGGTTGLTTSGGPITGSGTITLAGTLAVANGGTGVTSSTGSGSAVLSNSPTLVTPSLGTPSALVGTNITGTAAGLSIGGNATTATTSTNIAGGTAKQIPVQTGSGATTFIPAPTTASTVLTYNGTTIGWAAGGGGGGLTNTTEVFDISGVNTTIPVESLQASGTQTDIDYAIAPKGTGGFALSVADGTVNGGNKRGQNAVDLQIYNSTYPAQDPSQVASGEYSFCTGLSNTASGPVSACIGSDNSALAPVSTAIGLLNFARGQFSLATGVYANDNGSAPMDAVCTHGFSSPNNNKAQVNDFGSGCTSTGSTPTLLTTDGNSGSASNQLTIMPMTTMRVIGSAMAKDTVTGDYSVWDISCILDQVSNAASTTVAVPLVTLVHATTGAATWAFSMAADTTNGSLALTFTGSGSNQINTSAIVTARENA